MQPDKRTICYAVVDDEEGAIEDLRWELNSLDYSMTEVAIFTNPVEATLKLQQMELDLLFLDISMPVINGICLVESLEAVNFDIVFTTAYDQYAIEAFRHNAIDYLLKPVNNTELSRVLDKHLCNRLTKNMKDQLELLKQAFDDENERLKIYIKDEYRYLPFSEIVRLEAKSNYTSVFTTQKEYLVSYPLKEYEQQLPTERFIKVHRSHIVNKNAISGIGNSVSRYITMSSGDKIPVSRSKYLEIKLLLNL